MISFYLFIPYFILAFIAVIYYGVMIEKLRKYPSAFEIAGSPNAFWSDGRTWKFLLFVLKGRFETIPDKELIKSFQNFRIFEIVRLTAFIILFLVMIFEGIYSI